MKVIICGAGQVGFNIARYIASPYVDVTLIDSNLTLVEKVQQELDVRGVHGMASLPSTLDKAGAKEAELLIAVTQVDEINMMACQVAHSLFDVEHKIARVRQQDYLKLQWNSLYRREHLPIDSIISPEREVAKAIFDRLQVPGVFDLINFAEGAIKVAGIVCTQDTPVLDSSLAKFYQLFSDLRANIITIIRDNSSIELSNDTTFKVRDRIYAVVDAVHLRRLLSVFGHEEDEGRRIVIMGGGNVGLCLAQMLEEQERDLRVKLVERDYSLAQKLALKLNRTTILHGDALDRDILSGATGRDSETIVAVTNDDEANILSSLLAKKSGSGRAISLVSKDTYGPIVNQLGIDAIVNPRTITVSSILRFIRKGRVQAAHSLPENMGEVLELQALETSEIVGKPLVKVGFPQQTKIGLIRRGDEVLVPKPDTIAQAGDHIIIFTPREFIKKVEALFAVHLEFF